MNSEHKISINNLSKIILIVVFLLIFITTIFEIFIHIQSADDAYVVNVAGNQRMLNQKMTKEAIIIIGLGNNTTQAEIQLLQETRGQFETAHQGLKYGDNELDLPGFESEKAIHQWQIIDNLWLDFKSLIISLENLDYSDLDIRDITIQSIPILSELNKLVEILEQEASQRIIISIYGEILSFIVISIIFAITGILYAKIRESEKNFHDLFEYANDAILISDPTTTKFLDANETAIKRLGYSKEELLKLSIIDIGDQTNQKNSAEFIENNIQELKRGEKIIFETVFNSKNGLVISVEISSRMMKYGGKHVIQSVARDITDRKQAEEDRLQLIQMESLAILAGGIAHDYNNLLGGILGNVNLMDLSGKLEDGQKILLSEIEETTYRARDLTKRLLTFSKGGDPITRPVSIKKIIEASVSHVMSKSKSKCIISLQDKLPAVEVDSGQIEQLISSILINADQSMGDGGLIKIDVIEEYIPQRSKKPLSEGKYVKISIQDEGMGIPKEIQSRIFDPYFTTKDTGSGLGLATSYSIAKRHGGTIAVTSKVNEGSSFFIYLQVAPTEQPKEKSKIDKVKVGAYTGSVLFMDDDLSLQKVIGQMLRLLGLSVDVVNNGQEAIEMYCNAVVNKNPYSLVIMDLTIPEGMGGKDSIKKLLEIDPNITAIISSGYSNDPVMANYKNYGFKDILIKPYNLKQLERVIANHLS